METTSSTAQRIYDYLDYVPFASSFKSFYALFYKYVLGVQVSSEGTFNYSVLGKDRIGRHLLLLIPFLGNILVGIHDAVSPEDRLEIEIDTISTLTMESSSTNTTGGLTSDERSLERHFSRGCAPSFFECFSFCIRPRGPF
jgi:hypothetical protein